MSSVAVPLEIVVPVTQYSRSGPFEKERVG
jgi:hypothetical protein